MFLSGKPVTNDDASSIYSRAPQSRKSTQSAPRPPAALPVTYDLPEINSLDHQIALARGSTIVLETTRARLRCAKTDRRLSLPELREEKLRQWECQDHENRFYKECLLMFQELSTLAIDVSQYLMLQHEFEPEVSPIGNRRVLETAHQLREALEQSRAARGSGQTRVETAMEYSPFWVPFATMDLIPSSRVVSSSASANRASCQENLPFLHTSFSFPWSHSGHCLTLSQELIIN